ncbi:TolC family protein [Pontibacter beigongshangensis]|uniref:TolC family protein n=1 Tax=Pontibacter beigongshangensis TaxID=2574733 RepID=UPI00164FB567|nr:TolC family protein [Pontibacter beigongshangensis]
MSLQKTTALLLLGMALLWPGFSRAQEKLTLEQAIEFGLQHNYDIRIVTKEQKISENNVTLGNAGFLPSVDARYTRDFSRNDIRNQFENNEPRIVDNSTNRGSNASLLLNWTLFDGGRMFINNNRLKALERSGAFFTKATVESTLADIITAYHDVVRQARKINSIEDAIAISEQRVNITQEQYNVGVSAKVEILRAQVDYNADRAELLRQMELLQTSKINLNQLLGRDPNIDFVVDDVIEVANDFRLATINNQLLSSNPNLQRLRINRDIAIYDLRSARAMRLPTVGLAGGYGINRSIQDPQFFGNTIGTNESNRQGFNYGLTFTLPIFNGLEINRQIQNSRIAVDANSLALQREQNNLQSDMSRAFTQYQNRLQLLELEESNVVLAKQNAEIAMERYRLGLLTAIELREAQRNQLVAETRLIDIQFEAKVAETELKRIGSTLLQESN